MQPGATSAEDVVGHAAERYGRKSLRERAEKRAHALGASPEERHHDVEPGSIERRILRGEGERGEDDVRQCHRGVMGEDRRHEEHDRDRGRDRADQDPPGEHAAAQEQVADCPAGKNADHAADADDEQHERPERLVDRVLTRDELDTEGLHA